MAQVSKMFATQAWGSEAGLQNYVKSQVLYLLAQSDESETLKPQIFQAACLDAPASSSFTWTCCLENKGGEQ